MEKITNVKALSIVLDTCELSDEVRAKLEKMKIQFEKFTEKHIDEAVGLALHLLHMVGHGHQCRKVTLCVEHQGGA